MLATGSNLGHAAVSVVCQSHIDYHSEVSTTIQNHWKQHRPFHHHVTFTATRAYTSLITRAWTLPPIAAVYRMAYWAVHSTDVPRSFCQPSADPPSQDTSKYSILMPQPSNRLPCCSSVVTSWKHTPIMPQESPAELSLSWHRPHTPIRDEAGDENDRICGNDNSDNSSPLTIESLLYHYNTCHFQHDHDRRQLQQQGEG